MTRVLLILACALALTATPAGAVDKVKVGFIATFSGPIGQHMYDAFLLGIITRR